MRIPPEGRPSLSAPRLASRQAWTCGFQKRQEFIGKFQCLKHPFWFVFRIPFRYKNHLMKETKKHEYNHQKWLDAIYRQKQSATTPQPGSMKESESWRDPCSLPNTSLRFRLCMALLYVKHQHKQVDYHHFELLKVILKTIQIGIANPVVESCFCKVFRDTFSSMRHDSSQKSGYWSQAKVQHLCSSSQWFLVSLVPVSTASVVSSAINHIQKNNSFKTWNCLVLRIFFCPFTNVACKLKFTADLRQFHGSSLCHHWVTLAKT